MGHPDGNRAPRTFHSQIKVRPLDKGRPYHSGERSYRSASTLHGYLDPSKSLQPFPKQRLSQLTVQDGNWLAGRPSAVRTLRPEGEMGAEAETKKPFHTLLGAIAADVPAAPAQQPFIEGLGSEGKIPEFQPPAHPTAPCTPWGFIAAPSSCCLPSTAVTALIPHCSFAHLVLPWERQVVCVLCWILSIIKQLSCLLAGLIERSTY